MSATPLIRAAAVLVLAAAASTGPASAAVAGPAPASPPVSRLSWAACGGGFECSTARVPLDYDRPHGRRIDIALIRLPAADPDRRIGSLFVNPGGPGNSGVEFVREAALSAYPAGVRARYDIVGMDPRGVGSSTAVRCFADCRAREAVLRRLRRRRPDRTSSPPRCGEPRISRTGARPAQAGCCRTCRPPTSPGPRPAPSRGRRRPAQLRRLLLRHLPRRHLRRALPRPRRRAGARRQQLPAAYATGPRRSVPFLRVNAHLGSAETLEQFFALCAGAGPGATSTRWRSPYEVRHAGGRLRETPLALPDGRVSATPSSSMHPAEPLQRGGLGGGRRDPPAALRRDHATRGRSRRRCADDNTQYDNTLEALLANVCSETDNPRNP